jgi:glucose-1-phosphate adenylyltransferase
MSVSLHRHISNTYKFDMFSKGFVEVLAAQQTNESADWYQGTADAVRQNLRYIHSDHASQVLILSGDQLYRMDYSQLLQTHHDSGADVTIAALPVSRDQVAGFGILRANDAGRVTAFIEKPKTDKELADFHTPSDWIEGRGIPSQGRNYLASMGIYVFNTNTLCDLLCHECKYDDFGKEVFPASIASYNVQLHLFDGYWEDLGTIKSYHEASLALAGENPPFEFHAPGGVIYTRMRNLPAARIVGSKLINSTVSDGCVVGEGTTLERCIIGVRGRIGRNVTLKDSVLMGSDYIESEQDRLNNRKTGVPDFTVGDGSVIESAIIDKDCRIGKDVKIINARKLEEAEGANFVIRDGIVVIPRGAVVPDGTVI